jgi:hypothetical protein
MSSIVVWVELSGSPIVVIVVVRTVVNSSSSRHGIESLITVLVWPTRTGARVE